MQFVRGFRPISSANSVVLILGSLPGQKSLEVGEYYAQPRNAFWKIVGSLFDFNPELTYSERKRRLIKNRVAVWDVLAAAQRRGSLDSSIVASSAKPNDLRRFLMSHPNISLVCFNGTKAEKMYRHKVLPILDEKLRGIRYETLPSTSSACTSISFEEKVDRWSIVQNR